MRRVSSEKLRRSHQLSSKLPLAALARPRMPFSTHPVLISGSPSVGKTELRDFLRAHGATVVSMVTENLADLSLENAGLRAHWDAFEQRQSDEFVREVRRRGLILEWGFPPGDYCLNLVSRIAAGGIPAWWLDGDMAALRHSHEAAGKNLERFDHQAKLIREHRAALHRFYGERVIQRVNPRGEYLPAADVCARMFAV